MLYNASIFLLRIIYLLASFFNDKARLFVAGRQDLFSRIKHALEGEQHSIIWVHCASLGEFEQGRPIMEALKQQHPDHKIFLTFFSPSGYEVRKNYSGADYIFYLPWDTPVHARKLIELLHPQLAIFIKYEFWLHLTLELKRKSIPVISACSIFRPDQVFFKWYGSAFRKILKNFDHFFVQSPQSIELLKSIGIHQASLAGDTRFDRVFAITQQVATIDVAEKFKGSDRVMVIGSLWPEDLEVLAPFINEHKRALKFIIAPHEISEEFITEIEKSINAKCVRFSNAPQQMESYSVLIIDNVGMLSRLYRYGEYAFVGGAYGKGLHNILEAACFGVPIFFGNKNYEKYQEAKELIMRGGAFAIADYSELKATYEMMVNRPENFLLACEVTKAYVHENLGATQKIISYCHKYLGS